MENFPLEMTLRVVSNPQTHQGRKRPNNEDWVVGFEPNDRDEILFSGFLYIVADGVGGASKGERASQYAAQKVLYDYYQHPEISSAERLASVIRKAGNEIYQYSTENATSRMATTLVAAVIRGDKLTVANVGDSRAYLIRDGYVTQITRDHNLANELVRNGALTPEEAKHNKARNKLMRSLGGEPDVDVDLFRDISINPGDLILLCTDGLTRYATDADLLRLSAGATAQEISQRLIDFANESGGADNITLYAIEIKENGQELPKTSAGLAPGPVDWETMQTQSSIPQLKKKVARKPLRNQNILLYLLAGLLGIVIITSGILLTLLGRQSAALALEAPASQTPAPTLSMASSSTPQVLDPSLSDVATTVSAPTISVTSAPIAAVDATPNLLATKTPLVTPIGHNACVHIVQETEFINSILELYKLTPVPGGVFYQYPNCDVGKLSCKEPAEKIQDPNKVFAGEFLQITQISNKESCESVSHSYWMTVIQP